MGVAHAHEGMKLSLRLFITTGMLLLAGTQVRGQQDPSFAHYWALQAYHNPAASGLDGMLSVHGVYAMQMMGYEHAPATMLVAADLPVWLIGPAHGVGAGFQNDKIGLFEHKRFYVQYAYHARLFGGRMSVGVRPVLAQETFSGTRLDLSDTGDPAFPTSDANGTAFDLDAGLRFDAKAWYAGMAVTHALAPTVTIGDTKTNELQLRQTYYLMGGYNIRLRQPLIKMQTAAMVRSDLISWRADLTARMLYDGPKGKLYAGVGYSPTVSATVYIGGDFHGIQLGYAYECYTSGIGALHGSHEVSIGYTADLNLFKRGRNRHQSVRLL